MHAPMLAAALLLSYTPALRPPALSAARSVHARMQLPDFGKMGQGLMETMGMNNAGLSDEEAKSMEERLRAGEMTFDDFLVQVKVM